MQSYKFTITDNMGTCGSTTSTDSEEIMEVVRGWFPEEGEGLTEALDELDAQLNRPIMDVNDVENILGITVDREII